MNRDSKNQSLPKTRSEAKALVVKRFFTGKLCKHGHMSDRYTSTGTCSECIAINRDKYRLDPKNKEKVKKQKLDWYYENRGKELVRMKEYYYEDHEETLRRRKEWCINNEDKIKKYYAENKDRFREYGKEYRKNNEEHLKEKSRLWSKSNKDRKNEASARRRASIRSAMPEWADREAIKIIYSHVQFLDDLCGIKHHVDHIYPLQGDDVCGLHVHFNLQILPEHVNLSKFNRSMEDFLKCQE